MKNNPTSLRITRNTSKTAQVALVALVLTTVSHAALTAVNLTTEGSSAVYSGTYSIGLTLNDGFSYAPNAPTSTAPALGDSGGVPGFHGDASVNHYLRYSFDSITTGAGESTQFVVDLWGRNYAPANARDNNYTITLYLGDFTTTVGSASALTSIADTGTPYQRTAFNLTNGMTFDRFEIRATNTQYFTIAETRAAFETVPEPASALLGGLGLLALLRRRR